MSRREAHGLRAGSVAFEYLLVSLFALVVGMAMLGLAAKLTAEHLQKLMDKTGVELDQKELDPWRDIVGN